RIGQRHQRIVVDVGLGYIGQHQHALFEVAVFGARQPCQLLVCTELVDRDVADAAVGLELGDVDDAVAAAGAFFLEPVAAVQPAAAGAAQQRKIGFAVLDLGRGRYHLGQDEGADDPRDGDDPEHGEKLDAADPGNAQDDQLVALGQAGKCQDGADQQAYGQQLVQPCRKLQRLQVEQVQQGELGADVVEVFDKGEE